MKKEVIRYLLTALLTAALIFGCLPGAVFAESMPADVEELVLAEGSGAVPEELESGQEEPEPIVEEEPESAVEAEPEPIVEEPEPAVEAEPEPAVEEEPEPVVAGPEPVVEEPEPVEEEIVSEVPESVEETPGEELEEDSEAPEIVVEPADVQLVKNAVIADGLYMIESALSENYVLEIQGNSLKNKGNAALGTKTGDFRQAFYVKRCGEDLYTLKNYYSGLVIDVNGGMSANGTNIQQYEANGSEAQKWRIVQNEDGTVTFFSVKNGKTMDVACGKAADGSNVQIYAANGTAAQNWRLAELCGAVETMERLTDGALKNGYYRIVSSKNKKMCLAVADGSRAATANIALYQKSEAEGSVFEVKSLGGGLYQLTAVISGQVFDLKGGLTANGTNIRQYPSNGTAAQKWFIKKDPETGYYAILSGKNKKTAADLACGRTSEGTNLRAYLFNGSAAQFWEFEKTDIAALGAEVSEGFFRILPASNPKIALAVSGVSNGGNAALAGYAAGNEQVFAFSENADGSWTVRIAKSGKVLDIAGGSRKCGANVQQYTANGTTAQKIAFVPTGKEDRSYTLLVYNAMALDIACGKIRAGTNVQLYTPNGTAAQTFILEKAVCADGWVYDAAGNRQYAKGGKLLTGWQTVDGKTVYFDKEKGLLTNCAVDGYYVDGNGVRVRRTSPVLGETINGQRTLKTFLHNALIPAGRTLYIWGGGWGGLGTDASSDSAKIGFQKGWETFYDSHATASYDHKNYRWAYGCGLDCSGFVAWAVYNTMYTGDNVKDIVVQSTSVAPSYINWGWAYQDMSAYRPGDVVSMSGHVWISLGKCSDGTILLVHSSPQGVQLSGTGGKAVQLAAKYMKILAPGWPYAIRTVDYPAHTTSKATWKVNGSGLFTDPDHIQGMSAEDVLRTLIGS